MDEPTTAPDDETHVDLNEVLHEVRSEIGRMAVDLGIARAAAKAERRRRLEAEARVQEIETALASAGIPAAAGDADGITPDVDVQVDGGQVARATAPTKEHAE